MANTWPAGGPAPPRRREGWTAGRVASVVVGALLALASLAVLAAGGTALWASQVLRHNGYLSMTTGNVSTVGYALTSSALTLGLPRWVASSVVGQVRIQVTPTNQARPVFVGIAPSGQASSYLAGVRYMSLAGVTRGDAVAVPHGGSARPASPLRAGIWAVHAAGTGPQTLLWTARPGSWTVIVMNRDGSPGVAVSAVAGITAPALTRVAAGLLAGGVILLAASLPCLIVPARRAARPPARTWRADGTLPR